MIAQVAALVLFATLTFSGTCGAQESRQESEATLAVFGNPKFARLFVGTPCAEARQLPTEQRATAIETPLPTGRKLFVQFEHDVPGHKESVSCTLTVSFVAEPGTKYAVRYQRAHAWSKHLLACEVVVLRATKPGTFEPDPSAKEEENKTCDF